MKTEQMHALIAAITGRKLTLACDAEEIPLEAKIGVYREGQSAGQYPWFTWKTPRDEDNIIRSFVTAFCNGYREPNPASYFDYDGKPRFDKYADAWNNPATRADSPCWQHHAGHMLSREQLRAQVERNFAGMSAGQFSLCFYPTVYGIGIFTLLGGKWVDDSLSAMSAHLSRNGIPFRNEMSRAHWVTRFLIGATKEMHTSLLSGFSPQLHA